jgi:hypothetical protein
VAEACYKDRGDVLVVSLAPAPNTDNKGKLFVMLFADSEPLPGSIFSLKPGYAHLQVIKLFIPRQFVAPG